MDTRRATVDPVDVFESTLSRPTESNTIDTPGSAVCRAVGKGKFGSQK